MEKTFNPYILSSVYTPFTYNLTDQSALSNCPISAANSIYTIDQKSGIVTVTDKTGQYASQTLPNTTYNTFNNNKYYTNGTPVIKRGVEWVIDFKEISALKTSVKLDGAYSYYKGEEETIIPSLRSSGKMSDGNYYKYIGYYVGGDNISNGSTTKRLTTNVTLTTHIPVLRLIFSVRAEGCFYDYSQYLSEYAQKSRGFVIDNKDAYFPSTANTDIYAGDRFVAMYPLYYTTIDDMNTKIPFAEKFAWAKDHDNDFAITIGFPGITQRYITSYELKEEQDLKNRATVITKGKYIDVLKKEMDNDEGVRLKYSTKNFMAGNSYKLALGMMKLVSLSPAFQNKQKEESDFTNWVKADPSREKKYGNCLAVLASDYEKEYNAKYAHDLEVNLTSNLYWINELAKMVIYNTSADDEAASKAAIDKLSSKELQSIANKYFGANYAKLVLYPEK